MYTAYGLTIASELPLPELSPSTNTVADVHICYGDMPDKIADSPYTNLTWQAAPGKFTIHIHNIANYFVEDGCKITIDRIPDSKDVDVRTFLLGSPLGALLHQRKLLALHGSAISTSKGAIVFLGRSGSGKSTLLAGFQQRGYSMLSDDIIGIDTAGTQRPIVLPAIPQTKLWPDVVEQLDLDKSRLTTMRQGMKKLQMPLENYSNSPIPLYAIYMLTTYNRPEIKIDNLTDADKLVWLVRHTYRKRIMYGLELQTDNFNSIKKVINSTQIHQVTRPSSASPFLLDELVDTITENWS